MDKYNRFRLNTHCEIGGARKQNLRRCCALQKDGTDCSEVLHNANHDYCRMHFREKNELWSTYKTLDARYTNLQKSADDGNIETLKERIKVGVNVVEKRDEVNRRFFSRQGVDNRGHVKRILKIKNEVDGLRARLASPVSHLPETSTDDTTHSSPTSMKAKDETPSAEDTGVLVYRSLLSDDVPMSELDHLPRDSPVIVLKQVYQKIRVNLVDNIYRLYPSLNDSEPMVRDVDTEEMREPDKGDLILRNVFREFLVYDADTETLARANRTKSISEFLTWSSPELLNSLTLFFKTLGREDTTHLLRNAIYDFLLPEHTPCIDILGGRIGSETNNRSMSVESWDIFHEYFGNFSPFPEQFSFGFDDSLLEKKLRALSRYRNASSRDADNSRFDDYELQQQRTAAMLGFAHQTTGFLDSSFKQISIDETNGNVTETEARQYVAGRMSKKDPCAKLLMKELGSRVVRMIVYVFDAENRECVFQSKGSDIDWITRSRSASAEAKLAQSTWKFIFTMNDILQDLGVFRGVRDRMMTANYYDFIVVSRIPGRSQGSPLDCISDALIDLRGMPMRDIVSQFIRDSIPLAEQDSYLQAVLTTDSISDALEQHIPDYQYVGNRVRTWDSPMSGSDFSEKLSQKGRVWDPREVTVLYRIVRDLEAAGAITKAEEYANPHVSPTLVTSVDGGEDLFFDYHSSFRPVTTAVEANTRPTPDRNPDFNTTLLLDGENLRKFANAFQSKNPKAVFVRGTIKVSYCAWPIQGQWLPHRGGLNFATPHGHLYKWNHWPFDFPNAFESWQYLLHCKINCKFQFARATETTVLICAASPLQAEDNLRSVLGTADENGWKLSVPRPDKWTRDIDSLQLSVLWKGIRPLATGVW